MLRLKAFGALKVLRDGELAVDKEIQRKQLVLLVVLATDGEQGVTRDRLIGLLWPDKDIEKSRALLSQALHRARLAFGEDVVLEGQTSLQLNAALLSSDVGEFRQALARGDLEAAVAIHDGPFLNAVYIAGAPEFEQWAHARRTAFSRQCVDALITLSRRAGEVGDLGSATDHARRAAGENPHSSEAVVQLMTMFAWAGDRVAAIDAYRVHATLVKEDLDSEPNPEVTALAEKVRAGEVKPPKDVPPPAPPTLAAHPSSSSPVPAPPPSPSVAPPSATIDPGQSVAVLPFVNISLEPQNTYFADGTTDSIINALSRLPNVRVCARTTMFGFRNYAGDPCELGRRLGVRTVVVGTVITDGGRVRVSAHLITVDDASRLWLGQFDRELLDIFAVHDEISEAIARTLRVTLTGQGPSPRPTVTTAAYEQFLLGRHYRDRRNPQSFQRALACYQQALKFAPNYAQVYAAVADTLAAALAYGVASPRDAAPRIREAAAHAIELDPSLAEPHAALGTLAAMCDRDWAAAEKHFKRALALTPNYQTAQMWYANYCLAPFGKFEEGLETLQRARRLDLLSPVVNTSIGMMLFFARRYDEAVKKFHGALEIDPGFPFANYFLGRAEVMRGNFPAAIESLERTVALSNDAAVSRSALGYAHARAGDELEARAILERLEAPATGEYVSAYEPAFVHLGLGDDEAAVAGFERAAEERTPFAVWLGVQPETDDLRGTPRFDALERRIGVGP